MDIDKLQSEAENGSVVSQTILGILYLEGDGVTKNYAKAKLLLESASEKGVPRAMSTLGRIYELGLGVEKNLNEASSLYQASAETGEFLPHIWLARMLNVAGYEEDALYHYEQAASMSGIADCAELEEAKEHVRKANT